MIECINFRECKKGTLLGFADFALPKMGIEIHGCTVHKKNDSKWVNLPSKEYQNKEGETKYAPIVKFIELDHYRGFQKHALEAVNKFLQTPQQQHDEIPFLA